MRSYIADLDAPTLKPQGWDVAARPEPLLANTDMAIYELHVRDFSLGDASVPARDRGKYLGFTHAGSAGMRHLRVLRQAGMTDIHLLPVFDIATIPESGCVSATVPEAAADSEAQQAAVAAATVGTPCEEVDAAARRIIAAAGWGEQFLHRTGHGIGLDIHEWPYLVGNDTTPLDVGMCFSNEPMICIPGEFGIRHEDHFYMTADGPRWFTQPAHSIDDPFGLQA